MLNLYSVDPTRIDVYINSLLDTLMIHTHLDMRISGYVDLMTVTMEYHAKMIFKEYTLSLWYANTNTYPFRYAIASITRLSYKYT